MLVAEQLVTPAEFDAWVLLPENADHSYELIAGRILEVVSNQKSSAYGSLLGAFVTVYVVTKQLGFTTGADGGYWISGERYIPDCAFVSKARQPAPTDDAYSSIPPDLAIEVLSPSNTDEEIRVKIANYLSAGTVVWVADPDHRHIEVYEPGKPVRILRKGETLTDGSLLPGFAVAVNDIFP